MFILARRKGRTALALAQNFYDGGDWHHAGVRQPGGLRCRSPYVGQIRKRDIARAVGS